MVMKRIKADMKKVAKQGGDTSVTLYGGKNLAKGNMVDSNKRRNGCTCDNPKRPQASCDLPISAHVGF